MKSFDIWNIEFEAANFKPIPTEDNFLDTRYQWQMHNNAVEWPYYRFFYYLSKVYKPSIVVELGGWQGTAAAHFAAGNPDTQVFTIDHHTDPGDDYNRMKMLEACERYSNIQYLQGWTNPELTESQKDKHSLGNAPNALPSVPHGIDILFIDSWHTYDNAMLDWKYYKPLLNSPALVICDDIQDGEVLNSPIYGMLRFWREMSQPKFLNGNLHPGTNLGFMRHG